MVPNLGLRLVLPLGAAACAAAWAVAALPPRQALVGCVLGWILVALAAVDLRRFVLPDTLTLSLIAAGLLEGWVSDPGVLPYRLAGAAAGFAALAGLAAGFRLWRGRDGLGLGDAKLLAAAGAWVSLEGLPSVLLLASAGGLLEALARRLPAGAPLAFGPHLCLGFWLVWLSGPLM